MVTMRRSVWGAGRGLMVTIAGVTALAAADGRGGVGPASNGPMPTRSVRAEATPAPALDAAARQRVVERMAQLPLRFEANHGQWPGDTRFAARGLDYGLRLTPTSAELSLGRSPDAGAALRVTLPRSNARATLTGLDRQPGAINYYRGSDPAAWRSDVRTYARVRYEQVYDGIDLIYYGNQAQLEYDFTVAPGADAAMIRMRFEGASRLEIDSSGELVIHVPGGQPLRQHRPIAYQTIDGGRREVASRYAIDDRGEVGFVLGPYDRTAPLTIDPVIVYSTFFGGDSQETIYDMALDAAGNIYVTGTTLDRVNFPTTPGAFQPTKPGVQNTADGFVSKFNPGGSALVYSTFLGGSGDDNSELVAGHPAHIAVDAAGNAHVAGNTQSANFPVSAGAADATFGGTAPSNIPDGFYVKLGPTGAFLYGTFIGGTDRDYTTGIGVDAAGNAYVTGMTRSDTAEGFQTTGTAHSPTLRGAQDAFLMKFDVNGARVYSTYVGGDGAENNMTTSGGIAVDAAGIAYVIGDTASTNFPIVNGRQTTNAGGQYDVFLAKYNTSLAGAASLLYSTYLGGSNDDAGHGVALAGGGVAYVVGQTRSANFPVQNALYATFRGGITDAFVAKLDTAQAGAASLLYATFLGGSANDMAWDVAVDPLGGLHVVGDTFSTNFPLVGPVLSTFTLLEGFLVEINPAGTAITFSTYYLPGGNFKTTTAVAANAFGDSYIAGGTNDVSSNPPSAAGFPIVNAFQGVYGGGDADAFIARFGNPADTDNDGLPNDFETRFGLSPIDGSGDNGPSGDPDGDGLSNLQEYLGGSHPRGFVITYLAEGATGTFFDTRLAIANPTSTPALVLTRFQKDSGSMVPVYTQVGPHSRATVDVETIAGMESAAFSSLIEADVQVVADRTMTWGSTGFGSHAERGILTRTSTTWYLAEGATHGFFDLFYLLQNPGSQEAHVEITYLLPAPAAPIVRTYTVAPTSRLTIYLDQVPGLESTDVSASLRSTNNVPFIAERAMYFSRPTQTFAAGHESAGVTSAANRWFLAEGATGSFFNMFILVANPSAQAATVEMQYLLTSGQIIVRNHVVAAQSRFTINVATEDPALTSAAMSTIVTSTNNVPIVVERAMWWPSTGGPWYEAHNSPGETTTGVRWAMAEGESGGPQGKQTYILIANTSPFEGAARVTLLFEDGTTAEKTVTLPANSRTNVNPQVEFAGTNGRRYGALIESLGATPAALVVERAMYSNAGGVIWAAGTNALATKLQ